MMKIINLFTAKIDQTCSLKKEATVPETTTTPKPLILLPKM